MSQRTWKLIQGLHRKVVERLGEGLVGCGGEMEEECCCKAAQPRSPLLREGWERSISDASRHAHRSSRRGEAPYAVASRPRGRCSSLRLGQALDKLLLVHVRAPGSAQQPSQGCRERLHGCVWRVKQQILCEVERPMYEVLVAQGGTESSPCLAGPCHYHRSILPMPGWSGVKH